MKLDIKDFIKSPDTKMEFSGELEEQESKYNIEDLNLQFPIKYEGTIFDVDGQLLLDLSINYKYNTQCDRCLKPIVKEEISTLNGAVLTSSIEKLVDEPGIEYLEIFDDNIFLDDIIISQIITSKPYKNICDESCKGLCPKCGKDLNEGYCDCKGSLDVDLRFEKLLNLFNDEEV